MSWTDTAAGFSAMGSDARLQVLKTLVRAGPDGLTVSEIRARTGQPASTLAHHLKTLVAGHVITQTRVGRQLINRANFDHLAHLAQFILSECCADQQTPSHD